ncbi:MAG: hypothetical protein HN495_02580 [Chloroflexi bacterium]|jgi:hypothetical protein|nr:hypothetical protein [Chloroflexota bacterium]
MKTSPVTLYPITRIFDEVGKMAISTSAGANDSTNASLDMLAVTSMNHFATKKVSKNT